MLNFDNTVVYDNEHFPNASIVVVEALHSDQLHVFEFSPWRNDLTDFCAWFDYMGSQAVPMISFNGVAYDYPMLHFIRTTPNVTPEMMYAKNESIINSKDRFGSIIWDRDRLVPQIDLRLIHHYDNQAKSTSLKALQINMRSETVMESPIPFGTVLTEQMLRDYIIPYGKHDVYETKRFAHFSRSMIKFREGLISRFGRDVLNWNDTKIGEQMLIQRLGEDICFDRSSGRKVMRQTIRTSIPVRDIIFPYIRFETPEFQRVLEFMRGVTLGPEDMKKSDDPDHVSPLTTRALVGGLSFRFGSGGVHASVERQRFNADDDWAIRDIDVAGMYPAISNVNKLAPEHLGAPFIAVYAMLPEERAQYAKGTAENLSFKLAGNAAWGKSKSLYSCFYDPAYALTVPINGQLMICMLAEQLLKVPTLQILQANTDGITYYVRREHLDTCKAIEYWWQAYTCLKLEDAHYKRMYIRDVNNYICEYENGKYKLKGAYWWPQSFEEALDAQAAHKDYNPIVVQRAAIAAMFNNIDPATFLRCHSDPFDFMCRVKLNKGADLWWGDEKIQSTTRYYVSRQGRPLAKIAPPPAGYEIGAYKKAQKITKAEYDRVMAETGGQWDERVHTRNKSKYENVTSNIQSGWLVTECNDIRTFTFDNVNYDWYLAEVQKLII